MERDGKRHAEQFTDAERALAERIRRDIIENGERVITFHCQEALDGDGATESDLADALRHGVVVEISRRNGDYRIVTRLESGGVAHCAVFSQAGAAIAYWQNHPRDGHSTLDITKYSGTEITKTV